MVTRENDHCPDCGLIRPLEKPPVKIDPKASASQMGVAGCLGSIGWVVLSFIIYASAINSQQNPYSSYTRETDRIVGLFLLSILVGPIVIAVLSVMKHKKNVAPSPSPQEVKPNLRSSEQLIKKRISEITVRVNQIKSVLGKADKSEGEQWEQVRRTLKSTLKTLQQQHTRYSAKLLEIEVVRWQNKLPPLIADEDTLTYELIEKRLVSVKAALQEGQRARTTLQQLRKSIGPTSDIEELSNRVDETISSCSKLQDALIGRQAVLALKGVSPIQESAIQTSKPISALRQMEAFNTQVAITDFSSSFQKLEAEYVRLQAEEEVVDQVSEDINRADRAIDELRDG